MQIPRYAPLSVRVARELRQQLDREYISGGKLPSEPELASRLGVSRGTVRQAMTILEREGVIYRRQGSGTFVNKYVLRIRTRAEYAYEFSEMLRIAGYEASIRAISVEHLPLPQDIAVQLDTAQEIPALFVRKLFLADGQPAIFCEDILPEDQICGEYAEAELKEHPIFNFLKERCGQHIDLVRTELIPQIADESLAALLEIEAGKPLLRFDETSLNQDGIPVLFSRIHFKDEFIRFTLLRKKV